MRPTQESRPGRETEAAVNLEGNTSLTDGTPNLRELDDALPFGASLYADVPDMADFIRLTIRNAAAHIDVKKHRAAVKV